MSFNSQALVFLLFITTRAAITNQNSEARVENGLKSKVYFSPKITQYPGSVSNKIYYNVQFPKGHLAIKSFTAELVDETANPISLQETYLHHWVAINYYLRKTDNLGLHSQQPDLVLAGNAGICSECNPQVWGLGAETRRTASYVPDPYGIEVGNPMNVPVGFKEQWLFNIHTIDTRGAVDAVGCAECRCDLYNVTKDRYDQRLKPDYVGGKYCCYDGAQCKVKNGFQNVTRNIYLKYTVKWVEWSNSILPVKVYMFDVTDTWQHTGTHKCSVEYDIEKSTNRVADHNFTSTKRSTAIFPVEGYVIYGVGHQHSGGKGSTLYGEDGRVICSSTPIYGKGNDAGDEAGYVVGMSTCYPEPGSVKIGKGETLTLESNYSSVRSHTGVMGLFYILVAETLKSNDSVQIHQESKVGMWFLFGLVIFGALLVAYGKRLHKENGYQSIAA